MKIKHELISYSIDGVVWSYWIRLIKKYWWSKWEIIMDGDHPQIYDKINGNYIARL